MHFGRFVTLGEIVFHETFVDSAAICLSPGPVITVKIPVLFCQLMTVLMSKTLAKQLAASTQCTRMDSHGVCTAT